VALQGRRRTDVDFEEARLGELVSGDLHQLAKPKHAQTLKSDFAVELRAEGVWG